MSFFVVKKYLKNFNYLIKCFTLSMIWYILLLIKHKGVINEKYKNNRRCKSRR